MQAISIILTSITSSVLIYRIMSYGYERKIDALEFNLFLVKKEIERLKLK